MRIFCFSFIVYLVILLTQPCQDLIAKFDECSKQDTQIAHTEKQSDPFPQSDDCSPFCFCSCCSLSVANRSSAIAATARIEPVAILTATSEYRSPNTATYHDSIWQPPKA